MSVFDYFVGFALRGLNFVVTVERMKVTKTPCENGKCRLDKSLVIKTVILNHFFPMLRFDIP